MAESSRVHSTSQEAGSTKGAAWGTYLWHHKHVCSTAWYAFVKYTLQERQQSPHKLLYIAGESRGKSPAVSQPFGLLACSVWNFTPHQHNVLDKICNSPCKKKGVLCLPLQKKREAEGHGGCYTSPTVGEFGRPRTKTKIHLESHR